MSLILSDGRTRKPSPAVRRDVSIVFDEQWHTYTVDGVRLPSVSRIIRDAGLGGDYSAIDPAVLERARQRGVAVHAACEEIDRQILSGTAFDDVPSVADDIAGYVEGYRRFVAESRFQVIDTEVAVAHVEYGYAGRLDAIGWIGGFRTIVDRKAVAKIDSCATSVQCAAYALAWEYLRPLEAVDQVAALHLRPSGEYALILFDLLAARSTWIAALQIHRHKQEHRGDRR